MNNNSQSWYCSWWAIIIAFIIFWPIGIVLLILRNGKNKQSVFLGSTSKKKYIIAGVVLILFGLSYFSNNAFMGFFMIVGGIALIVYAEKLKKRGERNRRYIDLIVNQGDTSLDKISNVCNIQYNTVVTELRQLIKIGVLKNAVIDENYRTIMIQRAPVQQENLFESFTNAMGMESQATSTGTVQNEKVTCTCPGCGAKIIRLKGSTENCEYCDAPIYAK